MEKRQASSFYPHFEESSRPTIDYFVGLFNQLVYKDEQILTGFLDPNEQQICQTVMGNEVQVQAEGGYELATKKRLILSNNWDFYPWSEFKVQALQVDYAQKFSTLTHSQILGVLTNLGVTANSYGDIITDGQGQWQFFVKEEMLNFFVDQIDRIGKNKVKLRPVSNRQILEVNDDSQSMTCIASSLRLDNVVSAITNKSRSQIKTMIEQGLIKLNWHDAQDSNIIVTESDTLSIRHFGRVQVENISLTKKARYKVAIKLWKTKRKI